MLVGDPAVDGAVRLGPVDDATAVTAAQLRAVVERLIAAGQWQAGDPHIVSGAGYDVTRLARVLRDLPVERVGRVRSDRVMRLPKPQRMHGVNGRPPKHGPEFRFTKPETWPEPAITTVTDTPMVLEDRRHPGRRRRVQVVCPTCVPQPRGAGPGRPPGTRNKLREPCYDVGKTVERPWTRKAIGKPGRLRTVSGDLVSRPVMGSIRASSPSCFCPDTSVEMHVVPAVNMQRCPTADTLFLEAGLDRHSA